MPRIRHLELQIPRERARGIARTLVIMCRRLAVDMTLKRNFGLFSQSILNLSLFKEGEKMRPQEKDASGES